MPVHDLLPDHDHKVKPICGAHLCEKRPDLVSCRRDCFSREVATNAITCRDSHSAGCRTGDCPSLHRSCGTFRFHRNHRGPWGNKGCRESRAQLARKGLKGRRVHRENLVCRAFQVYRVSQGLKAMSGLLEPMVWTVRRANRVCRERRVMLETQACRVRQAHVGHRVKWESLDLKDLLVIPF